jgi:hypothetical protein
MRPLALVALVPLLCLGCTSARSDDALEPNNTREQATPLTSGTPVEGRANQNNPDVFAIDVPAGKTALIFHLESVGLEDCAAFTVEGPDGQTLYDDGSFGGCERPASPTIMVAGAALMRLSSPPGYELRIPAVHAGRFLLTVDEQGQADNIFLFSWDYRLTARLE